MLAEVQVEAKQMTLYCSPYAPFALRAVLANAHNDLQPLPLSSH